MRMRLLLGPLLLVAGAVALLRHRDQQEVDPWVDDAATSTVPTTPARLPTARAGSPDDRGAGGTVKVDLQRATAQQLEPVVEYLTYVQARRGDRSHLMFVRSDDLDAMAAAADEPADEFLARLDQLGVVVSHN